MKRNWMTLAMMALAMLAFVACSSDDGDGDDPSDPTGPTIPEDGTFAGVTFDDFSADARRVLPPVYSRTMSAADSVWHDDLQPRRSLSPRPARPSSVAKRSPSIT